MPKHGFGWAEGPTQGERMLQDELRAEMVCRWLIVLAFACALGSVVFAVAGRLDLAVYCILLALFFQRGAR
jgi:hypothetical protein